MLVNQLRTLTNGCVYQVVDRIWHRFGTLKLDCLAERICNTNVMLVSFTFDRKLLWQAILTNFRKEFLNDADEDVNEIIQEVDAGVRSSVEGVCDLVGAIYCVDH